MQSLNLGILAHVDAGKTSLTERLLYSAGVIDQLGSVDKGDTQTDFLALERQRGITIKSAVASLSVANDLAINLIDTPGHPDFIAEVERVLRILDGAVLVLSAVEGVQPRTRVLIRALRRLGIRTMLFVNKIDRAGAREGPLLREISQILGLSIPMGVTSALGTKAADFTPWGVNDPEYRSVVVEALAEHDEQILTGYIEGEGRLPLDRLQEQLRAQTKHGLVYPVFFGSACTGAGIEALISGIADLLPAGAPGDPDARTSGTVFKIERGTSREKIVYVRMFSGTVRTRDRLVYGQGHEDKVSRIATFDRQPDQTRMSVSASNIAKIWGLRNVQIGDWIGQVGTDASDQQFALPTMESVVESRDPADRARLRVALGSWQSRIHSSRCDMTRISTRRPCGSMGRFRKKSSSPPSRTIIGSKLVSARRRRSISSARYALASLSSCSLQMRIRTWLPSLSGSNLAPLHPACSSDSTSTTDRCRCTSTRRRFFSSTI